MNDPFLVELNNQIHDRVLEYVQSETRGALLDVGAGDGTLSERLRTEGFDVRAVDQLTTDFRPADIEISSADLNVGIPFADGEFAVVVATEVIEHLENPWLFVRELYRVTKPGGVVVISTPNLANVWVRAWYVLTGQCIVVKLRRRLGPSKASPRVWTESRIIRGDPCPASMAGRPGDVECDSDRPRRRAPRRIRATGGSSTPAWGRG